MRHLRYPYHLALPVILLMAIILAISVNRSETKSEEVKNSPAQPDQLKEMQERAAQTKRADWGNWGFQPDNYMQWDQHSNRLIPVYTFGITLNQLREEGSPYRDPKRLKNLYGTVPKSTVNPHADYYDQTDIFRLQRQAVEAGYRHIILIVFDGMDWQTTHAAACYKQGKVAYQSGRGRGLSFLEDYRVTTDFGLVCTSALLGSAQTDVNAQTVTSEGILTTGGYDVVRGGHAPWNEPTTTSYLLGKDRELPHTVTDSAASATSMTCGVKTYNGSINYTASGDQLVPIARDLQQGAGFKVGIVSSVPISHATPAAAYSNNVTRKDYQDISRDLLGLRSVSHKTTALQGLDLAIGGGWSPDLTEDTGQGSNYLPGNRYLHQSDLKAANVDHGGNYVVATRSVGKNGSQILSEATDRAIAEKKRLLGFFGTRYDGHLPFQTADGGYDPASDGKEREVYSEEDQSENPTLAQMTRAALQYMSSNEQKFWLMIEAGDVDWANHSNNIDNSIGAVFSGEAAFNEVMQWADEQQVWDNTAVIVTSDHGHFFVNRNPEAIAGANHAVTE